MLLAALALCACGPKAGANKKPPTVRVRSFTEAGPVTSVALASGNAFVASDRGLAKWDLETGNSEEIDLFGLQVTALELAPSRGSLWLATSAASVAVYDIASGVLDPMPEPEPGEPASLATTGAVAVAPTDEGAWVGGPSGLAYVSKRGEWAPGIYTRPVVTARVFGDQVWLGTGDGGGLAIVRADPEAPVEVDDPGGCARLGRRIVAVAMLGEAPDGGPLVVGDDGQGRQRVLLRHGDRCHLFRVSPSERWLGVARRSTDTVVMTERRLYSLGMRRPGARRLRRDGMRLVSVAEPAGRTPPDNPFLFRNLDARPPRGARSLAATDEEILIGTERLGTARLGRGGKAPRRWLRSHELSDGGGRLSVACTDRTTCFVGTGGRRGWRFDGSAFQPLGGRDTRVFSVSRAEDGQVFAVYRDGEEPLVRLARLEPDAVAAADDPESMPDESEGRASGWSPLDGMLIETPGVSDVTVARISPSGTAWVGLRYRDREGDLVNYGVAEVDLGLGAVAYHHASRSERSQRRGILPIPLSIADLDFLGDDEVWLASNQGATRIAGREVLVYGEAEGLLGEMLRGIAVNTGGTVFVASRQGIGVFDGIRWDYPKPLQRRANALAIGQRGQLWIATPRGLAVYDGARVRRFGRRRGLLSDEVLDVEVDAFGRVWALTSEGINIVTLR